MPDQDQNQGQTAQITGTVQIQPQGSAQPGQPNQQAAAKLVEATKSNLDLANEALNEAQQRFHAGVSDNLPVSQAQTTLEQANDQYISALYQHNVAKLSLARALGVASTNYKQYLGGK